MKYFYILIILGFIATYADEIPAKAEMENQEETSLEQKSENNETQQLKNQIKEKLNRPITIKLTHNPKDRPLTLGYVLFKIFKKTKVNYLRKRTKENISDIDDMEISKISATNKTAAQLIRVLAGSRGLEHVVTTKGVYFRKKERTPRKYIPAPQVAEAKEKVEEKKEAKKEEKKEVKKAPPKKKTVRRRVVRPRRSGY